MRTWVWFLALLSGLRIWCCHELWWRSQTRFGSGVAVALAQASSCSSDSTPSLERLCTVGADLNKTKQNKKCVCMYIYFRYIRFLAHHVYPLKRNQDPAPRLYYCYLTVLFSSSSSSFCLFRAAPAAYGGSQARGQTGVVTAALDSHNNARSEPCLWPTP